MKLFNYIFVFILTIFSENLSEREEYHNNLLEFSTEVYLGDPKSILDKDLNKEQFQSIKNILKSFNSLLITQAQVDSKFLSFINTNLCNFNLKEKEAVLCFRLFDELIKNVLNYKILKPILREKFINKIKEVVKVLENNKIKDEKDDFGLLIERKYTTLHLSWNRLVPSIMCYESKKEISIYEYTLYVNILNAKAIRDSCGRQNSTSHDNIFVSNITLKDLKYIDHHDRYYSNYDYNKSITKLESLEMRSPFEVVDLYIRILNVLSKSNQIYLKIKIEYEEKKYFANIKVKEVSNVPTIKNIIIRNSTPFVRSSSLRSRSKERNTLQRSLSNLFDHIRKSTNDEITTKPHVNSQVNSHVNSPNSHVGPYSENDKNTIFSLMMITNMFMSFNKKSVVLNIDNNFLTTLKNTQSKKISDFEIGRLYSFFTYRFTERDVFKKIKIIGDTNKKIKETSKTFRMENLLDYITLGNDGKKLYDKISFKNYIEILGLTKIAIYFLDWWHLPIFESNFKQVISNLVSKKKQLIKEITNIKKQKLAYENSRKTEELPNGVSYITSDDNCYNFYVYLNILAKIKTFLGDRKLLEMLEESLIFLMYKELITDKFKYIKAYECLESFLNTLFELLKLKTDLSYLIIDNNIISFDSAPDDILDHFFNLVKISRELPVDGCKFHRGRNNVFLVALHSTKKNIYKSCDKMPHHMMSSSSKSIIAITEKSIHDSYENIIVSWLEHLNEFTHKKVQ